jgi:hypothetical protein
VVRVANAGNGQQELLAVGNFSDVAESTPEETESVAGAVRVSGPMPLPYSLPE